MNWAPPTIAAALACLFSLIELAAGQKSGIPLQSWHWVGLRLAIEGSTAAVAYAAFIAALSGLTWFVGPWPVLLAGLVGPAILRSQLALLGSGEEDAFYGPAQSYRRLQKRIDTEIDDVCNVTQAHWVTTKALPGMMKMPFDAAIETARTYYNGLDRLTDAQKADECTYLDDLLKDASPDEDRYRSLIYRLLKTGGRRLVKKLMQS